MTTSKQLPKNDYFIPLDLGAEVIREANNSRNLCQFLSSTKVLIYVEVAMRN